MDTWIETGRLVEAARDGDALAWQELVDRFSGLVLATARRCRVPSDDLDDVFQVVWIRLVENLDRIREPQRLAGWLSITTRREAIRVQSMRRHSTMPDTAMDPSAEEVAFGEFDDAEVVEAMHALDAKCRRILHLTIVEERSYEDIAGVLGIAIGSVGPSRKRCLERLRRGMGVRAR